MVIALLVTAAVATVRMQRFQTWVVNRYFTGLEKKYEGKVSVGKVLVRWPHRIEFLDLLILDPLNDTLFYSSSIRFSVNKFNLDKNRLSISRMVVENPITQLRQLPSGQMNYELLFEALKSTDSLPSDHPFTLDASQFLIRNGKFQYRKFGSLMKPGQVNWDHLEVSNIEIAIKHFDWADGAVKASVDLLSCNEQSGFAVNKFSAGVLIDSVGIHTSNLYLQTGNSLVESPSANAVNVWKQAGNQDKINLDVVLGRKTYLSPTDLTLLTGINTGIETPLEISGLFYGSTDYARLQNASLNWENLISFEGDLIYNFAGTLQESFFDMKTRSLVLHMPNLVRDVLSGQIPGFELEVPEVLTNLGSIEYSGVFTGTVENFVTSGDWKLENGAFTTNLQVNKNRPVNGYNFKGSISSADFNPDQWVDFTSGVSDMTFNLDVDGVWEGDSTVTAMLSGDVRQFTLNGYNFQYLSINGMLTGKKFDGSLKLRDPNAAVDLTGDFDFGQSRPVLDFRLLIRNADLSALNLVSNDTVSKLVVDMHGRFKGSAIDNADGEITVKNSSYTNSRGTLPVNDLTLSSVPEYGRRKIILSSEYVDARVVGDVHADDFTAQVKTLVARFIPAVTKTQAVRPDHLNDFAFNFQIKNFTPLTQVLFPGFQCKDNSRIGGFYNAVEQTISIEGKSPQFVAGGSQYTGIDIRLQSRGDSLILSGAVDKIQLDRNTVFEKIDLTGSLSENRLALLLNCNLNGTNGPRGKIGCTGLMTETDDGLLNGSFSFPVNELILNDSLWRIEPFRIYADRDKILIDKFLLSHGSENLSLNGAISVNPLDTLYIGFNRVDLDNLSGIIGHEDFSLKGHITGEARLYDMRNRGMFLTEARIDSLTVNGQPMGLTTLSSRSSGAGEPVLMDVLIERNSLKTLKLHGQYNPRTDSLDFDLDVDQIRLDIFNSIVYDELLDLRGTATGKAKIMGTPALPMVNGNIWLQDASFIVDYLNTRFTFSHNVVVTPDAFTVSNVDVLDEEKNHAQVSGFVRHNKFSTLYLDLEASFQDFVLLNEVESRNEGYWGRGYGTGVGTIRGPVKNLTIDVSARTSKKTKFYVPVSTTDEARLMDFITYVEKPREEADDDLLDFSTGKPEGYKVNLNGATVNIDLEVTNEADVQLIFDSKVGDVIHAKGTGNLHVLIPPTSRWTLNGDYTIDQGDYQFTLQNMPVKRLQIEPGATLKWTGDVSNAQLDIDAVYRTKASLYDLLQDESNTDLMQRLPVECHLLMTGFLESPVVEFNINLPPTSNDIARTQLENLSKEELGKQVISLLVLNRFTPLQGTGSGTASRYEKAGISTTTEVLSNQLSYWLSQISNDFDVGFNYRPGDQLTSDEVEVALSKQFLNNRMTINVNGNYDVRPTTGNTSQLVGDVDVEYKIKPSGKVRVKAFTRANDHLLYEYAPYTQGVGVFYREEFDTFNDLLNKYREKWFRK